MLTKRIFIILAIISMSLHINAFAKDNISRVTDYVIFKSTDSNAYICGNDISSNIPKLYLDNIKSIPYSHYHHLVIDANDTLYMVDSSDVKNLIQITTNVVTATSSPNRIYYSTNDRFVRYYDLTTQTVNHVQSGLNVIELAAGLNHLVMRDHLNNIYAYGDNQYGQLGQGHYNYSSRPKLLGKGYSISASDNGSYWLATNNYVYGVGDNQYRAIRDDSAPTFNRPTIAIPDADQLAVTQTSTTGRYRIDRQSIRQRGWYDESTQLATINPINLYDLDIVSGLEFISTMDPLTDSPASYINGEFIPTCGLFRVTEPDLELPPTDDSNCKPGNGYGDKNHCHVHKNK